MAKAFLLILFLSCFHCKSFSQDKHVVDSLKKAFYDSHSDTVKIKSALELSLLFQGYKIDSAYYFAKLSETILQKSPRPTLEIKVYSLLSELNQSRGREDYQLEYLLKALKVATKNKLNVSVANVSNRIANYYQKKNFQKVIEYYTLALNAAEKTKDKILINEILNSGSNYYFNIGDYKSYLAIMDEQIRRSPELRDEMLQDYGDFYRVTNDLPKAKAYYQEAIKIYEDRRDSFRLVFLYNNYSLIPGLEKNYNEAIRYRVLSKNFAIKLKLFDYVANQNARLANIYFELNDYKSALLYNTEAINYLRKKGEISELKDLIKFNSEINFKLGNASKAYNELKEYIELENSQNNTETQNKISLIESSILEDKKQNEINLLNKDKEIQAKIVEKQKTVIAYTVIGFILVLVFSIFIFRSLRLQNRQNKIIAIQKKQSDDLLLNILPFEVAEELKANGSAVAKSFENVSVLFSDFVGFTLVGEKLTPKELVAEIDIYFTAFDAIIEKNGLEKIKTIGDAYLAVCGLPLEDNLHAKRTVKAALEILEFIDKREKEGGKFKIRIGINSGSVVAGIVGVKKFAYDIWGDTVNTAARMEQNSIAGKINISGSTFELVKNEFSCTYRGKIQAKNKGEIDMYFVDGENINENI